MTDLTSSSSLSAAVAPASCLATVALGQGFADADDGHKAVRERGLRLARDGFICLAEVLAALGVSDDGIANTGVGDLGHSNFARERAFDFPITVLRRHTQRAA